MAGMAGTLVADQLDDHLVLFSLHSRSPSSRYILLRRLWTNYTGKPGKSLRLKL
jgi:hypothetical protein